MELGNIWGDPYKKQWAADKTKVETEGENDYPYQAGAYKALANFYATVADNERHQRLALERNPASWVGRFLDTQPGLEEIKQLLEAIHYGLEDQFIDLSDVIAHVEDLIYDEQPPEAA